MNKKIILIILMLVIGVGGFYFLKKDKTQAKQEKKSTLQTAKCLKEFKIKIEPANKESLKSLFSKEKNKTKELEIKLKNISREPFLANLTKHNINISYRWHDSKTKKPIEDGLRTKLNEDLWPYKTVKRIMKIAPPKKSGNYILGITLVQEGCGWFNDKEPNSGYEINYKFN